MIADLLYIVSAALFVFGLKRLSKVRTARLGNQLAALGMLLAVVVTLFEAQILSWPYFIAGVALGGAIGAVAAIKVAMTAMPQMVALFNGSGGLASALVALASFFPWALDFPKTLQIADMPERMIVVFVTIGLSVLVGGVTFTGSLIAYGKLQGLVPSRPVLYRGQNAINFALIGASILLLVLGTVLFQGPALLVITIVALTLIALVLGVLLVIPIGGADMPVVISLLNSYSGIAASMAGFVIDSPMLIISGALVGAAGLILTAIMCKAMNRSLANVIFGGFGAEDSSGGSQSDSEYTNIKSYTPEEAAMIFDGAGQMIIVPGYGLAVAQAQHQVRELADLLEERGTTVRYAIHPVAGRMPGHMNVLLAEANVPYEALVEMDEINSEFKNADVVLILGANDVVNPAAKTDESSPIYGMPVLNVEEAATVMVVKRSLSPGFAGIKNPLFEMDNTLMLFGDAKKIVTELIEEVKEL